MNGVSATQLQTEETMTDLELVGGMLIRDMEKKISHMEEMNRELVEALRLALRFGTFHTVNDEQEAKERIQDVLSRAEGGR